MLLLQYCAQQFQGWIHDAIKPLRVILYRVSGPLVISRCCFAEDGKEMYQNSKRMCTAIVLLIKPFVW